MSEELDSKNTDMYVITQEGDRLDNLANEYYKDPNLWWFIARVNNLSTMNVPAGTSLRIPSSTTDAAGE
jgi:nucleoid-associated protein YgaU